MKRGIAFEFKISREHNSKSLCYLFRQTQSKPQKIDIKLEVGIKIGWNIWCFLRTQQSQETGDRRERGESILQDVSFFSLQSTSTTITGRFSSGWMTPSVGPPPPPPPPPPLDLSTPYNPVPSWSPGQARPPPAASSALNLIPETFTVKSQVVKL